MECFENLLCFVYITLKIVATLSLFRSLQMVLSRKIQKVDSCYSMKRSSLQVDRKYAITRAESVATRFGPAIVLAIRDTPDRNLNVFMPRRFFLPFRMKTLKQETRKKSS